MPDTETIPAIEPQAASASTREQGQASTRRGAIQSLAVGYADVPAISGLSRAHLDRMRTAGQFGPRVFKAGGKKLMVIRQELEDWILAAMPDATTWRAMQAAAGRRLSRRVS